MEMLRFDFWAFVLIIGIGQGVILGLALWIKNPERMAAKLAAMMILILTASLAEFLILNSHWYKVFPHLMYSTRPLLFLMGPLFYFFIRTQLVVDFRWSWSHLFHLVPFVLAIAFLAPWLLHSADQKVFILSQGFIEGPSGISMRGYLFTLFQIAITLLYLLQAYISLRTLKRRDIGQASKASKGVKFYLVLSKVFMAYWCIQLIGVTFVFSVQNFGHDINYAFALSGSVLIQSVSFVVLLLPQRLSMDLLKPKYGNSSLSSDHYKNLVSRIQELSNSPSTFTDSGLTLQKFSQYLEVNKSYVSRIINEEFGKGFIDLINDHRIEKAKQMLRMPDPHRPKMLAIALEVGFNNKTSFNRVFKKKTGQTPTEYRQSISAH